MSEHLVKAKILYVDDDRVLRQTVSFVLQQQGFQIRTASNGQEGVATARDWLPDLILMDLIMPVMDGFQATEILRADPSTQHIPILALTGVAEPSEHARSQAVGMNGFIWKSISLAELVKTIQAHLPAKE